MKSEKNSVFVVVDGAENTSSVNEQDEEANMSVNKRKASTPLLFNVCECIFLSKY